MPEVNITHKATALKLRYKGRGSQVLIYLGKQLRFFVHESDWKVLPMAAVVAGLVAMVIKKNFFVTMEGNLLGAFALACVAIWNGSFNSIQSVCRERAIIKREHRAGMHVSSYIIAHMIYQLMMCLLQTALTMYVLILAGVKFPEKGFMTPFMVLDIGITMLLITYASDMMSLFLSSMAHTTTGAMTLMPFILIFQLVFSNAIIPLPSWSASLANFTVSNYGIQALAAQSGYNETPSSVAWSTLSGMRDSEIGGTFTVGDLLDLLESPAVEKRRDEVLVSEDSINELYAELGISDFIHASEDNRLTVGDVADSLLNSEALQEKRDSEFTVSLTISDIFELFGEENVRNVVQEKSTEAVRVPKYDRNEANIIRNWLILGWFAFFFSLLSILLLEFIDQDKR
ncbi:MAG: ABC transporter permease [Clostridia bacterium]|nr:ABC transporter permease [Clostridia bacterium]